MSRLQQLVQAVRQQTLAKGRAQGREKRPFKRNLLVETLEPRMLLAADPLSVAQVSGSIDSAGEVDRFTFHLDAPAVIAVDGLTDNSNLNWSLSGPSGTLVSQQGFQSQASYNGNYGPQRLQAGDYQIAVQGNGDTTGAYNMRLLDLARSSAISLDTSVSGVTDVRGGVQAFSFDAQAGEQLFLTWAQNPGASLHVYDPFGQEASGSSYGQSGDTALPTLAYSGRYTVLLDTSSSVAANTAYAFTLHRVTAPVTDKGTWASAVLDLSTNLPSAGDRQVYRFSLNASRSVLLDSLTNDDNLRLSLTGPSGQVVDAAGTSVSDRGLANYVDHAYYGVGQLNLAAGDYTLVVYGSGTAHGNASLRLLDLNGGTAIDQGTVVSGQLNPGNQVQVFRFNATAGDNVSFDAIAASGGNPSVKLLDPYGQRVSWAWNFYDLNNLSLPTTGTYSLVVSGENQRTDSSSFSFQIIHNSNTPVTLPSGTPLVLGELQSGSLAAAGDTRTYNFSVGSASTLYFDPQSTTPSYGVYWSLVGPRGTEVSDAHFGYYSWEEGARLVNIPAGDYALTIRSDAALPEYRFRLVDLAASRTPVALNETVSGQLNPGSGAAAYAFQATAGQHLYFKANSTDNGNLRWRLVDPFGREIVGNSGWNDWENNLGYNGTYTLLVEGYNSLTSPINYSFGLYNQVTPPQSFDPASPYVFNGSWTQDDQGQSAVVFSGSNDVQVAANPALNLTQDVSFQLRFKIDDFSQTWTSLVYKGPNSNDANGRTYTLWANAAGYLYLTTSDNWGEMTVQTANGSIQTGQWYDMTAVLDRTSGQMRIYLNGTEAASGTLRNYVSPARVQDTPLYLGQAHEGWGSNNNQLTGAISEMRLWDVALTSSQISALRQADPDTADGHLKLWLKMDEGSGTALADASGHGLDGTVRTRFAGMSGVVDGHLDVPGQVLTYRLSLSEPKTFYLDSLTPSGRDIQLRINGPRINFDEGLSWFNNRLITLPAGDYTFTVDGNGRTTGSFAFRLIDTSTAESIGLDNTVSGTLNPGDTAHLYKLPATAGDTVYLQSLGASGFSPAWRLIDPFGREVFSRTGLSDRDAMTLSYTGDYLVIIDGDASNYDQVSQYSFRILSVPTAAPVPIEIDMGWDAGPVRDNGASQGGVQLSDVQYLEFPDSGALDQTGSFTLETSFYIDRWSSGSWIPLITKTTSDALRQIGLFIHNDGRIHLGAYPDNNNNYYSQIESAQGVVKAGGWHKVAAVYDRVNAQMRIVLDGQLVASGWLNPQAAVNLTDPLRMGYNTEGYDFYGYQVRVDDFAVWNRALSTEELAAQGPLAGSESGLAALYRMDEASGATLVNALGGPDGRIARTAELVTGNGAPLITGRLEVPGQVMRFQFTLNEDLNVYIDSLTRRYDLRWSLTGPGVSVSDSFYALDSNNARNLIPLKAGTYTITVDGDGAATGDFMFRVIRAVHATSISLNDVITGQLQPGEVAQLYKFDATAGQRVYLDVLSYTSQQPAWRLIDPSGAQVFGVNWMADVDTLTLARSGTYTLIVEDYTSSGARNPTRDFSFRLRTVEDTVLPLELGTQTLDAPTWTTGPAPGEVAVALDGTQQIATQPSAVLDLTGNVTIEAMVKVDAFTNTWIPIVNRASDWNHQTFGLYVGSSGQVNLDSNADGGGWYFGTAGGVIQLGQWYRLSATIDRTNGMARIYVNGVEMASTSIDKRAAYSLPNARLHVGTSDLTNGDRGELQGAVADVRLWNTVRTASEIAASQSQTMTGSEAGLVYNLALNEGAGADVTDSASSHIVTSVGSLLRGLDGTVVEGSISQVGERVIYQFTPTSDARVLFDSLTPDSRVWWTLMGPDGTVTDNYGQTLSGRRMRDSDAWSRVFFNLQGGQQYQLIVDGENTFTGHFAFRMLDLADAEAISLGTPVTWAPEQARTTKLYAFDATAGDQIVLDRLNYTDTRPVWRLFDPSGRDIFNNDFYYDSGTLSLAVSGRYVLALEGQIDARGAQQQSFQVTLQGHVPVVAPSSTPITFSEGTASVSGTTVNANEAQTFTFTLDAPTWLHVDTLNTNYPQYYNVWTLSGPNGTVDSRWAYDTDGPNHFNNLKLEAGTYTFSVYTPYSWATGAFSYRLIDLSQAPSMAIGATVSGTLSPANASAVYRFDATQGDRLFLKAISQSNMGSTYWRVVHADTHAVLREGYFTNNLDGIAINRSGSYYLMLEGYYDADGTASYSFTSYKSQDTTQALTLGATVQGTLAQPGDKARYTFTLDGSKRLWFDTLAPRDGFSWRILDGDGIPMFSDRDMMDYAWWNTNGVNLGAGHYTLEIDGNNASAGDYSFRLLDLSQATTVSTGTTVSGQLTPASQTKAFQFTAQAGDRYYFDRLSYSGGNAYWRLLDPYGQTVFGPQGLSEDRGTTTLTYSGTYTLLVEGYPSDTGTATFSFNITPVIDQAPIVLDIGVVPAPNLVVKNVTAAGTDGSVHSGGALKIDWQTANTGERDVTGSFQERIVVKNAAGETLVNTVLTYDPAVAGTIAVGAQVARTATVQLPAGARGAGVLSVTVFTDVGNTVAEQGAAGEADNSTQVQVSSTLLTYPDLTVSQLSLSPASNLTGGDQVTLNWRVNNIGDKATSQPWSDRVLITNTSTGEIVLDQTIVVDAASAAIAAGGSLSRQVTFNWPAGRKGSGNFSVQVTTDVTGLVAEYNASETGETNNSGSLTVTNAPDLQVGGLQVLNGSLVSGDLVNLQWTVSNQGNAPTPQGWFDRVQVYNQTTGEYLVNVDVAFDPVAATGTALAVGGTITRQFSVRLPEGARAVGDLRITVSVDQNAAGASLIPETIESNNDASVIATATPRPYPNLVASDFSAPATHRSGDSAHFSWTVTNSGNLATDVASWNDRVILSVDGIIGNSDDILLGTLTHSGVLAAGASYSAEADFVVPGNLDGTYQLAVVTDAMAQVNEPDTRANNTSATRAMLLTAYHADLVASFTSVPTSATGGDTMSVSWRVDNTGDAATNGGWWYDQLWLSDDGTTGNGAVLLGNFAHSGTIAAGEGYNVTVSVAVPNGLSASKRLVLVTDPYNYIFESRFDGNNTAVSATQVQISAAPPVDLQVVSVTPAPSMQPGQAQTVSWEVRNAGTGQARQPWVDQVFLSRSGSLNGAIYLGSVTRTSNVAAQAHYTASLNFTVPASLDDGDWQFIVLTDAANQVYENGAVDAETANTGLSSASTVTHGDLVTSGLSSTPLTGGQTATLSWVTRNQGSGNISGGWAENVYISTDAVFNGNAVYLGRLVMTDDLAAGATRNQSLNITPPITATGTYYIHVTTDALGQVSEASGEGNNVSTLSVNVARAPLPDLTVDGVQALTSGLAGRPVVLSWNVHNEGTLAAQGGWSEQVWLSSDNAIGGDILLQSFYFDGNDLAQGGSVTRTREVNLPSSLNAGNYRLVVRVDATSGVPELNELNNAAIASTPLYVGSALALTLGSGTVSEAAGASAVTGQIVRAGDISGALTVSLSSTLAGITLPATVSFAAGQSSASFVIGVSDNTQVDGTREGLIEVAANGYASGNATLRIVDNDVPMLSLSAAATSFTESHGPVRVTLTRNTDPSTALTVALTNDQSAKLTVPASVTFAAGESSVQFDVVPVNNTAPEGSRFANLSASAAGYVTSGLKLEIVDDDIPTLSLNLSSQIVSEGAGASAVYGTLTRSIVSDTALTVALYGDIARVRMPNYVTIAAGAASVDFAISIQENADADGDHSVNIFADVIDTYNYVALPSTRVGKTLVVTDNDGPTLSMTLDKSVVSENAGAGAAHVTITRNTPATSDLVVTLTSSDTTEATVPQTVTIAAGQQSVTVAVDAVADGVQDGTQSLSLIASAAGFNSGSVSLQVTDREQADLRVSAIQMPSSVATGGTFELGWTIENAGLGTANGQWTQSVYLSTDNVLGADDQFLGSFLNTIPLGAGMSVSQYTSIQMGNRVGQVYVFVVSDSSGTVPELIEANNTLAVPIDVVPAYRATVSTDVTQALTGAPVVMNGRAFKTDGSAQAYSLVTVTVSTQGMSRVLDALTDGDGLFSVTFKPLPNEAGHYTISADHPGVIDRTVQDSFDILGLKVTNSIQASLLPGQTVTGQLTVQNLSDVALHGVKAVVPTLPAGLSLTFGDPVTLNGGATVALNYTLSAGADMQALNGGVSFQIVSDEGAQASADLRVAVNPLVPQLTANPGYLTGGMLRGSQRAVSFTVTNTGGAATGPLKVQLPAGADWMSLSSADEIADLAPGATTTITLLLTPPADMPLQRYDGALNVVGRNSYVTVPFQLRAVSDAVGDVQVTVTDEYTYFAADKPNLAGATVQLLDPYTYQVVASQVTDATGIIHFTGVAEGAYTLQVSAPSHDTARTTVHVTPGGLDAEEVFLHRQAVTYTWTVVPTEVEDHYTIVLESTFETEVPMPVVTVDEPFLMPLVLPGYESQFNLTLRNHGLIDATQVQVQVPTDPDYIITPLIDKIDRLAAKSEISIPCKISIRPDSPLLAQLQASANTNSLSTAGDIGDTAKVLKCLGISAVYTYECKNNQWVAVPVQITPVMDAAKCIESIYEKAGKSKDALAKLLASPTAANLLSAGCEVAGMVLSCIKMDTCVKAMITTACKAATGALAGAAAGGVGAGAGALGGALSNWKDILACLCELIKKVDWGTAGGGSPGGGGGGWGGGGYGGAGYPYYVPVGYDTSQLGCSPNTASSSTDTVLGTQASNGVCAEVRLRIEQEAVITRTAFAGTLELNNGHSDASLTDAYLTLDIRDANGNNANDKFVVRGPTTEDVQLDANGHWTIKPSSIGKIHYLFVPTNDAAPDAPMVYSIGGTLHYVDGGTAIDVPLLPARITVYPEAKLNLDYFWQRDVVGDDPFTDAIEDSEPFALGLQVTNIGKGTAANMKITSAQPQIVENEKGLLVDFRIIGSQVGNQAGSSSLTVNLGTILPGATTTAQWNMVSSLQGKFKDFSATFEHVDDNGDLRTSLINQVRIHELIRAVNLSVPSDDHIPDYLANDVADPGNLPDTLYFSTGGQAPVTVAQGVSVSGGGYQRTVSATVESGWTYLVAPDALPGYELVKVTRSDGKVLKVGDTVWRTSRTWLADQPGAVLENLVKLVDFDSTGEYSFTYALVDHDAPVLQTVSGPAAGAQTTPVDSIDLSFSEPIDATTLTAADLQLSRDGVSVTLPDGLAIDWVSGNTWRISGLSAVTAQDGNYRLSVNAGGITDLAGNAGVGLSTLSWAMSATAPVAVSLTITGDTSRHVPVAEAVVAFSRDIDGATLDWTDLQLTRNGESVALNGAVSVTAVDARTFRITGLDGFTSAEGNYELKVYGAGLKDTTGVAGTGIIAQGWSMDTSAPTPVSLEPLTTNPRNIVVMSMDVTLSEAIDPTSFDWQDIVLTRGDDPTNLITSEVTVKRLTATTWRIEGFNWKVGLDGVYTLTVKGAGLRDLAGNTGTGEASQTWTMDIARPGELSNIVLGPDRGASSTDGLTNTGDLTVTGDLPESGMRVRVTDVTTGAELGMATVNGQSFTANFKLNTPGRHQIRLRAADAAANLSPDAFIEVFIDTVAPSVSAITQPSPTPRSTPVDAIVFRFDEAVDAATLDLADIALTRDGVAVDLSDATLTQLDTTRWQIGNLGAATTAAGVYALTIQAGGVRDLAGNAGQGSETTTWTTLAAVPTTIRGKVYEDLDGSGTFNPAHWNPEAGMAGQTLYLDANNNAQMDEGEQRTLTGADGSYAFTGLTAGSYLVRVAQGSGWLLTAPASGSYAVTLAEGHSASSADFGLFKAASISGVAFNDLNNNGTRDAGEAALSGWTVFLDQNANEQQDAGEASVVTGEDGTYAFTNLGPGTVQVAQVLPNGWHRSTPAVPYDLKSGMVVQSDLGNLQYGSITGMKFNDLNGNGTRDAGEAGVAGWTIFLDTNTNGVLDAGETSTVTDAAGQFRFDLLLPGAYTVAEAQRSGWVQTKPLPNAINLGVSTAGSTIKMEADCACGGTWATYTGPAMIDYGKLSMDTALATTGITALRQQTGNGTLDGRGTTTVVIDTGIDLDHSFFGGDFNGDGIDDRIVYQWDFANNDADASDVNGHGSNVASVIGSQDSTYYGVAPGTNLVVLKVFSDDGVGTFGYLEQALQWVLANREAYGIDVVNLSLGDNGNWTDTFSRYGIGDELAALASTDIITVGAAGNNFLQFGKMGVAYPASDPAVLAVGATWAADFGGPWTVNTGATNYATGVDQIAAFSQRSTELVDGFAPGARFNGANAHGGITTMQGTSQAAAFVSGAAALAQQLAHATLGRGLSTGEFAQLMRHTGDLITDGDDEVDNVSNTGEQFPRLNMVKLAAAIAQLKEGSAGGGGSVGGSGSGQAVNPQQAEAGVYNVALNAGQAVTGAEFGNFQLGSVNGKVFLDANRDGSHQAAEGGQAGTTVYLDANDNGLLDAGEASAVTDAQGAFSFADIGPGTVHVRIVAPAGLALTSPGVLSFAAVSGMASGGHDFGLAPALRAVNDDVSLDEDTVAHIDVLANDTFAGGTFTLGSAAHGTVSRDADGKVRYQANANYFGEDSFTYTIGDASGSATATVTVQVKPVNDAPVLDAIADQQVAEGASLSLDLHASDADNDALSFSLLQGPQGASVDPTSGHLSWTAGDQSAPQTFAVQVSDAAGATSVQHFTVQVQLGKLVVTGFANTAWGFTVRFNDVVDPTALNLYGAQAPDVVVTGTTSGTVKGSVVFDDDGKGFSFIRTGAQLAADSYKVTIRGATDGVTNTRRGALDGDANGSAGGQFTTSFTVAAAPAVRLRLPDFARGPNQAANVPNTAAGIPVTLSSNGTVTSLSLRIRTDVDTLSVSEIRRGADLPADATLVVTPVAGKPGQFDVTLSRASALPTGNLKLLAIVGSVPNGARLGDAGAIVLESVRINGSDAPLAGDAAVDIVAYTGDLDFDGAYTANDVTLVGRVGTGLMGSAPQIDDLDVAIVADVDGNGTVNALDTAQVLARTKATATAAIPAIPPIAPVVAPLSTLSSSSTSGSGSTSGGNSSGSDTTMVNLSGTFVNFGLPSGSGSGTSGSGSAAGGTASGALPSSSLRIVPAATSSGASAA